MTTSNHADGGISGSLHILGATVLALASTRAELFAVELHEEQERGRQKLTLVFVAAVFLAMGMLLAALLVVVLLWDTHRLAAAGGVAVLYLGIGGWALLRLRFISLQNHVPFAATLREFADDLKLVRGGDDHHQ